MTDGPFRTIIEEVRQRTDLVSLIGDDVALRPAGSVLKGRSPQRPDKDPSLVVWPHSQTWRDFSGGGSEGGDCFDYVMRRDGIGFMDALRLLAADAGVSMPGASDPEIEKELEYLVERRRVEGLLTRAAEYYHRVLPTKIREDWYRDRYGFSDETVNELQLGWADGHLAQHLIEDLGASKEDALATGLLVRRANGEVCDFFADRLVFPYWKRGRVVYFIARATEHTGDEPWEKAKYKKLLTRSDRHPYVSRHVVNSTFYNEDAAQGADELLITEGVTDCISARQAGVACVSPVTVRFRHKDIPKLVELTQVASRIVICNDAEESGAGEEGALETASALQAEGRDVRIGALPRPDDKTKMDINELVRDQGPDALRSVLDSARRYPEFLIERIPADTPKADLAEKLKPVIDVIRSCEPLLREACTDLLRDRFKLKAATLKALFKEPRRNASKGPGRPASHPDSGDGEEAVKGQVYEETNHYYITGHQGEPVAISSFQIEPTQRIVLEDGEIIDGDVTAVSGRVFRNVRFPREAWHCKRNLLKVLGPVDLQFTGSDDNVQGVLALLSKRAVPSRRGTMNLGYCETPDGPMWVVPDRVVYPEGAASPATDILYVSSGDTLSKRIRFPVDADPDLVKKTAAVVLPALLELNAPEVTLPIIGWFFASPLRPRIHKLLGHHPFLCIWGTPGSGKCVAPDTLVSTGRGIQRIEDLDRPDYQPGFTKIPANRRISVWSGERWVTPTHFYKGEEETLRVRTARGYEVVGTAEHPVMTQRGWVRLDELCPATDQVLVMAPAFTKKRGLVRIKAAGAQHHAESRLEGQVVVDAAVARLLGYLVADGWIAHPNGRFALSSAPDNLDDAEATLRAAFGCHVQRLERSSGQCLRVSHATLRRTLESLGLTRELAAGKCVPWSILRSPRSIMREFLRAYISCDGHIAPGCIEITTASETLSREVQILLLGFGIPSTRQTKMVRYNGEDRLYWRISVFGREAILRYATEIGVFGRRREEQLGAALVAATDPLRRGRSRPQHEPAPPFFDSVESVAPNGRKPVYDLTIPDGHAFLSNGILSHNSSLIVEVFWPLLGVHSAEPYGATETEFAMLKLLSCTDSVPIFIDEYKPYDMPRHRKNSLHRFLRRLYTGEEEGRGRANQTVVAYRLAAPICLAGETRPIEAALVERMVSANPDKDELTRNPACTGAFARLKSIDLTVLTESIIAHLLGRDTTADVALARRVVDNALDDREVPLRFRDNMIAVVTGLICFEGYAERMGVDVPELDIDRFIRSQCDDLLESGGKAVKLGLDYFLEMLSSLAVSGQIQCGKQYYYSGDHLALHIPSCHAAYAEHCRRAGYEGEIIDKKALIRQIQENHRRGGYIVEVNKPTSFGSRADKRRATHIDMERAKESLDVDDFPRTDSDDGSWGTWGKRWGDD